MVKCPVLEIHGLFLLDFKEDGIDKINIFYAKTTERFPFLMVISTSTNCRQI